MQSNARYVSVNVNQKFLAWKNTKTLRSIGDISNRSLVICYWRRPTSMFDIGLYGGTLRQTEWPISLQTVTYRLTRIMKLSFVLNELYGPSLNKANTTYLMIKRPWSQHVLKLCFEVGCRVRSRHVTCLQNCRSTCPVVVDPVTCQAYQWFRRHECCPGVCHDADKLCVTSDISNLLTQLLIQSRYCCLPQIAVAQERVSWLHQLHQVTKAYVVDWSLSATISATARWNRTDCESLKIQRGRTTLLCPAVAAGSCYRPCQLSSDRRMDDDASSVSSAPRLTMLTLPDCLTTLRHCSAYTSHTSYPRDWCWNDPILHCVSTFLTLALVACAGGNLAWYTLSSLTQQELTFCLWWRTTRESNASSASDFSLESSAVPLNGREHSNLC